MLPTDKDAKSHGPLKSSSPDAQPCHVFRELQSFSWHSFLAITSYISQWQNASFSPGSRGRNYRVPRSEFSPLADPETLWDLLEGLAPTRESGHFKTQPGIKLNPKEAHSVISEAQRQVAAIIKKFSKLPVTSGVKLPHCGYHVWPSLQSTTNVYSTDQQLEGKHILGGFLSQWIALVTTNHSNWLKMYLPGNPMSMALEGDQVPILNTAHPRVGQNTIDSDGYSSPSSIY